MIILRTFAPLLYKDENIYSFKQSQLDKTIVK